MSPHASDLLLEYSVVKSGLELSASSRRRCNASCILTTTDNDIGLDRSDTGTVQGSLGRECLDDLEVLRIMELFAEFKEGLVP